MSGTDVYLELLKKVDRQVEDQGKDIKNINLVLSDGRVTFSEHGSRLSAVEREQATCAERVKQSVREVLNEQRATDRLEKKPAQQATGETTGIIKAIRKIGPGLRYAIIAGVFIGGVLGGMYAAHQVTKATPSGATP